MDLKIINQEIIDLRKQISGRKSLLQAYTSITNELKSLPKGKEHYEAILALTQKQEALSLKLKENKKLVKTFHLKVEEKAALLKALDPSLATKLVALEKEVIQKEATRIQMSESIMVATKLLNELGKLKRQGGKAKAWGLGNLLSGLFNKQKKHAHLEEVKTIRGTIRQLTRRYKKELEQLNLNEIPDLPLGVFLESVAQFINNPVTDKIIQVEKRKLLKKTSVFEAQLLDQLEQLEEKETTLEFKIKSLKHQKIEWIEKA